MTYDGLDGAALAAHLGVPSLLCLPEVGSTMDIVHDLAGEGAPAGTIVLADGQARGRGRQGRPWHSPRGAGVWLGYLLRPNQSQEAAVLSVRVGLAVSRCLRALGAVPHLKWPNDVLLGDRKVAGVLCEARWRGEGGGWIVVGIGLNVHGPLPGEVAATATVLEDHVPEVTRLRVLEQLVPELGALSTAPALSRSELAEFAGADWLLGRSLAEPCSGTARGLAPDGALLVETPTGTERIVAGSVRAA